MMDRKRVRARLWCYLVIGVMLPWTGESFAVGTEPGPFLLFVTSTEIGRHPLKENSSCTSLLKKESSIRGNVDYDPLDNQIYWSSGYAIYRSHFNGSTTKLSDSATVIFSFEVDSASRLLFYSQSYEGIIAVKSLTSDTQKVVLRPHKWINDLALHSQNGVIFWTEDEARIKRANYDGSNIWTILEDGYPQYLALDLDKQHIYWTSGDKLERSDLSGEGRTLIYATPVNDKVYIWNIAYSKSQLYWAEHRTADSLNCEIKQMDLHNHKTKSLCRFSQIIWTLHVHPGNDVVPNNCTMNNGGCSHICIPTPSKRKKCLCPDGLALQDDDTTCGSSTPPRKTKDLKRLAQGNVTHETVTETKSTLMKQPGQTSAEDVALTAEIVYRASSLNNITQETAKDVLEIVDFVSNLNQTVLEQSNAKGNTTNRMIKAVEEISDQISLKEREVHLETNTTFIHIRSLTTVPESLDVSFQLPNTEDPTHGSNQSSPDGYAKEAKVVLPREVAGQIVKEFAGRDIRVSTSGFLDTGLFRVGRKSDALDTGDNSTDTSAEDRPKGHLSSKVVSMRITVDGQPITDLSSYEPGQVTTNFQLGQHLPPMSSTQLEEAASCVFWDFDLEQGYGGWSQEGCQIKDILHGKVDCTCNHLTNFAVLMDFYGQGKKELDDHDSALGLISVMGLTFSISSLFLTLLFFVLVKELRHSLVHQALSHMALALFLSYVTFLAGIQRVADRVGCVVVAMVLHYLILASFLWMLAQGVLYYVTIVKGRSPSAKRFISMAAVLAWGLPIIPLATVSAIDVELYRGGNHYCWMSLTLLYYAFLTPIAVVVVINLVIYVLVMVSICRRPRSARDNSNNLAFSARVSFSCFCVMGLSWVFAFLAVEGAQPVFQYLFTFSTTFTGLFIFVMYTARHPAVKAFGIQCANRIRGASATPPDPDLDQGPAVQHVAMREMN